MELPKDRHLVFKLDIGVDLSAYSHVVFQSFEPNQETKELEKSLK